jgi:hypothetical protein
MEGGRNNLKETEERQLGIRSEELGILTLLTFLFVVGARFIEPSRSLVYGRHECRPYESKTQHFNAFRFSWSS